MLHLHINPHSGVPIYRQIMDQIRFYISARQLSSGDKLPSIRELAKRLHINPTTIVKAYSELQHEGDIEMLHGKGAFISKKATSSSGASMVKEFKEHARGLAVIAKQMGITKKQAKDILEQEIKKLTKDIKEQKDE